MIVLLRVLVLYELKVYLERRDGSVWLRHVKHLTTDTHVIVRVALVITPLISLHLTVSLLCD